jgi:hypothetical protein
MRWWLSQNLTDMGRKQNSYQKAIWKHAWEILDCIICGFLWFGILLSGNGQTVLGQLKWIMLPKRIEMLSALFICFELVAVNSLMCLKSTHCASEERIEMLLALFYLSWAGCSKNFRWWVWNQQVVLPKRGSKWLLLYLSWADCSKNLIDGVWNQQSVLPKRIEMMQYLGLKMLLSICLELIAVKFSPIGLRSTSTVCASKERIEMLLALQFCSKDNKKTRGSFRDWFPLSS